MVFMIVLQKAFSIGADRGTQRLAGSITLLQFWPSALQRTFQHGFEPKIHHLIHFATMYRNYQILGGGVAQDFPYV